MHLFFFSIFIFYSFVVTMMGEHYNLMLSNSNEIVYFPNCQNVSYTLREAAAKYNSNNTVFLMMVDKGYFNQFLNTYLMGNLRQYSNLIVVSLDVDSYKSLQEMKIHSVLLKDRKNSTEMFTQQASPLFAKKMQNKLDIIHSILSYGYNVLYMDSDIILLKDPFPFLYSINGYDLIAQKDITICTGFMFIHSTHSTIELFNVSTEGFDGDQHTIISALKKKKQVVHYLPTDLFSNGKIFWTNHTFYWDPISPNQIMIHNNWVRRRDNKDYRLKEMHLYALDVDGEYSNPKARYLTIERVWKNVTNYLIHAVKVANDLQRTLIIPPIPCPQSNHYCLTCAYDSFLCLHDILKGAIYGYRESVFFTNEKIPKEIRDEDRYGDVYSFSNMCENNGTVLPNSFRAKLQNRNHLICLPCNASVTSCAINKFVKSSISVLKLYSI